ncbi:unnamed protein product [Rotaria magnacalcarata]|uniref:Uncharacterized protein n=1 Tax=Rotaria magnacalcarata TaxID=392030 RepID=A0A816WVR0_9BILA|nr:unnamed protein product [Rotaria magnacalcarata]CAF1529563.1 unnamed protein product [Rotaria magnacalcarata]CAF2031312.1 unnamed protein product [Rotaria magnacalcarata]CAF2139035.1 unnamed protein product [Rotaria magnacalcarata]CAF2268801.1 unnamed protein product [Rotaria magnacalcarata]
MKSRLPLVTGLVAFFIISFQLTSSANFPNPPSFPPPNASLEQWRTFWILLHNYYAIIARPRFGKRHDSVLSRSEHPSLVTTLNSNVASPSLYEADLNGILGQNSRHVNVDQKIHFDELYELVPTNRKRR